MFCKSTLSTLSGGKTKTGHSSKFIKLTTEYSAVAMGGGGGGGARGTLPLLTTACAPHFGLLKLLFLEHCVTARQQQ